MRQLYVIGIGAGDPDQLTLQAIKAMNKVDVFFVIGKGDEKAELVELRTRMLAEHVRRPHRVVTVSDPPRERTPDDYNATVSDWHQRRAELLDEAFSRVEGVGGILVWGDPALYDSTLRVVEDLGVPYAVIPGVTSVSALAAKVRRVLHPVGEPVHITTGRRLRAEGLRHSSTVVMLDADCAFADLPDLGGVTVHWAAYLGLPDETIISGPAATVADDIRRTRATLRARKGWIMDVYLLERA